jgi:tetratricopeptide (TPR) repeat protein
MKQTSKDKIINESLADKVERARDLTRENKYW